MAAVPQDIVQKIEDGYKKLQGASDCHSLRKRRDETSRQNHAIAAFSQEAFDAKSGRRVQSEANEARRNAS